jgi:hypothetical protein
MSVHFHIRWTAKGLDWERHATCDEASESAKKLARPHETYVIEEFTDGNCPSCNQFPSNVSEPKVSA